jgi:hypothetical protein
MLALLVAAAVAPSAWLAWSFRDLPHFGAYHDDGIYLVTAKSLAEGRGYRILSFPGEPYQTKYPPLYPAILAILWNIVPRFPANLPWFALLSWVFYLAFLYACWRAFRQFGFGPATRAVLTAVAASTPAVTYFSAMLMPELLFCAVLLAALAAAERPEPRWAFAAGILGGLAFLLKALALPLAATVPLWHVFKRRRTSAGAFLAGMAPFVAGWFWWVKEHVTDTTDTITLYYTQYLRYHFHIGAWDNQLLVSWKNLGLFFTEFGRLLVVDLPESQWGIHLARLLTAAAIAGLVRLVREGKFLQYVVFGGAFFLQLLVWHYPPNERFLFPIFPLMLAGLYREVTNLACALVRAWRTGLAANRVVAAAFAGLLLAVVGLAAVRNGTALLRTCPDMNRQYRELHSSRIADYRWMAANFSPGDRVMAYDDPVLFLYTGFQSGRLTITPMQFYRQDWEKTYQTLKSLPELARRHGMRQVYVIPRSDFRGELSGAERERAVRTVRGLDELIPLHASAHGTVYSLR